MIDTSTLTCTCGSSYRSPGDYVVAIMFGIDVDQAHNLMDAITDCLDLALDRKGSSSNVLAELEVEYERALKARSDQASS